MPNALSQQWTEVRPGTFEREGSGAENILGFLERKTGGHVSFECPHANREVEKQTK